MKIYVDEMPKSCDECELVRYFKQKGKTMSWCPVDCLMRDVGVKNTCPLHSTAELQNEKAIKALDKLWDRLTWNGWASDTQFNAMDVLEKLEAIQAELKGEKDG